MSVTRSALKDLFSCLELDNCARNQDKVVLVENMYFLASMKGATGGEEIWATSTIKAMRNLGYTVLYAGSLPEAVHLYRIIPDLVKIVILNDWESFKCDADKANCIQSDQNPTGIPIYKPFPRHPLGQRWVLAPEPFALQPDPYLVSNNTYLGYSIEDDCALTPFVPHEARPVHAWVLAKLLRYLHPWHRPSWSKEDFDATTNRTGVLFALGADLSTDDAEAHRPILEQNLPTSSINYGRMKKAKFMSKIAQSKVLVGVGSPLISPTPYNGLCLGVPFINPLDQWDETHPDDTTKWHGQHAMMAFMKPPYVYNSFSTFHRCAEIKVRKGDREGFVKAVVDALANPIDSYVPERMRMSSVEKRLAEIVDHDWEAEARSQAEWCNEPCGCLTPCDMRATE
ncbi:hypothetical protein DFH09DRAFT_1091919 [Mycena vulgaris]|nr:hypothetical protein DFH09DRAFT_1091919 [Mycena vulgaris]